MALAETDQRSQRPSAETVAEPGSWWPFVSIFLGTAGVFALLVVHLLLEATHASAWGLAWMAVPAALICASVAALLVGSGMSVRERLAAIRSALLGISPREQPDKQASTDS
jgi:lysylphosphatidylglycerol synthetase-like protein (DUF2156 family)